MQKFPKIESEKDLEVYSSYLKKDDESNNNFKLVGKKARVEFLCGTRKEIRYGKILEFNKEYIILQFEKSKNTLYCDAKRVLFITVIN